MVGVRRPAVVGGPRRIIDRGQGDPLEAADVRERAPEVKVRACRRQCVYVAVRLGVESRVERSRRRVDRRHPAASRRVEHRELAAEVETRPREKQCAHARVRLGPVEAGVYVAGCRVEGPELARVRRRG